MMTGISGRIVLANTVSLGDTSNLQLVKNMRKKKTPKELYDQLVKELEQSYDRWNEIYQSGGSDPFWPDGVNLNLVHNHILYYGKQIAELSTKHGFPLPDSFDLPMPPEVDTDYMARRDEIRQNAKSSLKAYKADPNFQKVSAVISSLGNRQKASIASNILNYITSLEAAIQGNDYVSMRRHENPERYLQSAREFVKQLVEEDFKAQLSLDSFLDEEMEL